MRNEDNALSRLPEEQVRSPLRYEAMTLRDGILRLAGGAESFSSRREGRMVEPGGESEVTLRHGARKAVSALLRVPGRGGSIMDRSGRWRLEEAGWRGSKAPRDFTDPG